MTIDTAIHRNILIKILKEIFTHQETAACLGFKGGTAALLFYDLTRFSVDLDFNLVDEKKEDIIFETIGTILQKYGKVEAQKKRYSPIYLLSYKDKIEGAQNIKIEINKRNFGSKYEIKNYLGIAMRVMVQQDMVAHKLVAMHERIGKTNRDIFDVWFFLNNNWPVNTDIIELRTNKTYKEFLHICIDDLEKIGNRGILSGLGELLDNKQKEWVKSNLKSDTIFLLKLALSSAQ